MIAGVLTYFIGPDWWWVILVKAVIILLFLITAGAYLTLAERKVAARIQLRYGPNRVGPFGLLQPRADAVKLLFKENTAPSGRDKLLYLVAPSLAGAAAMFAFAAMPIERGQLRRRARRSVRRPLCLLSRVRACTGTSPTSTSACSSSWR